MANRVWNVKILTQPNTTRELYAVWEWDKSHTKEYQVQWQYDTGTGVWFEGQTGSSTLKNTQYTPPDIAVRVRVRIKPISRTHEVNGTDTEYWTAKWSAWVSRYVDEGLIPDIPDIPSVPNVSINNLLLTAELDYYYGPPTMEYWITFEIVVNDSMIFQTIDALVNMNHASVSVNVLPGYRYKVRAAAKDTLGVSSEFSEYSSNYETVPASIVGPITLTTITSSSVRLSWETIPENVTGYVIEYTTNLEYFDQSQNVSSVNVGAVFPYAIIDGLESGYTYYFRMAATNEQGNGPWSEIVSCILGTIPTPPTTWSSASTAKIGDQVILYWVHNSEDGSREREAQITIIIDGNSQTITQEKPEDDRNTTSYHIFDTSDFTKDTEVKWYVKTRGVLPTFSDPSTERSFNVYLPAVVYLGMYAKKNWWWDPFNFREDNIYEAYGDLSDPYVGDIVVKKYPVYVQATVEPTSQIPLECHFSIFAEESYETTDYIGEPEWIKQGDLLFEKTMFYKNTNKFVLTLYPTDITLENGVKYRLVCEVAMNTGLTASAELYFTVDMDRVEHDFNAEISYDSNKVAVYIKPYCIDDGEKLVPDMLLSVFRRNFDGEFIELIRNVNNVQPTTIVDPHPNLLFARYRIVGMSLVHGGISYSDLPGYPIPERAIVIQWDERWSNFNIENPDEFAEPVDAGSMLKLPYNIDVSDSNSPDVSLVEYIGRSYPVSYYGTQIGQESTWSVEIPTEDVETIYQLRRLSKYMGNCYVREPSGTGYWAQVTVSFTLTHCKVVTPVTINVKRVEGGV